MTFETGLDEIGLQMKQAANSRLRRDDVLSEELEKAIHPVVTAGNNATIPANDSVAPVPSDQALIEGLARVIASVYHSEPLVSAHWENYKPAAQAALLYMQQHVRPLVEALEYYLGDDKGYNAWVSEMQGDCGHVASKALSSLPPVLRGE